MSHFAIALDKFINKVAKWPALAQGIIKPLLVPFVRWRIRGITRTLVCDHRWLPPIEWAKVEKHGQNVVFCPKWKDASRKELIGHMVVDYKNKTVQTVLAVPDAYHHFGATF